MLLLGSVIVTWGSPAQTVGATTTPGIASNCGVTAGPSVRALSQNQPCVIAVTVGAKVGIALAKNYRWGHLHADGSGHVSISGLVARSTGGLNAIVNTTSPGAVVVSASGVMVCPAGTPCPALARLWSLRIVVVRLASSSVSIALGVNDGNRSVTLRRGDRMVLALAATGAYRWSAPRSESSSVAKLVGRATGGATAHAVFDAVGVGTTNVTVVETPACYPQCLMPSRLFRVVLHVTR